MPRRLNVSSARQSAASRFWVVVLTTAVLLLRLPAAVEASFLPPEVEDKLANFLAVFVLIVVPVVLIVLFWMVHVLPEKIAHKRHHPQFEAIRTLCLLSLVFGGLLWPIAWLWAYSKPVAYRVAYGTDKHANYHLEMGAKAREGKLSDDEFVHLCDELDAMQARGALPRELRGLREELNVIRSQRIKPAEVPA